MLLLGLCLLSAPVGAQSVSPKVLASGGRYASAGGYSVSYTVGEMAAVSTLTASGRTLTQGFQQPNDILIGILDAEKTAEGTFAVYPNPAVDKLWLGYEFPKDGEVAIYLTTVTGQSLGAVLKETYESGKVLHPLDCTAFAAGDYLITANYTAAGGQLRQFTRKVQIIR